MEFIIGCNYWASHAATEMWRNWNEDAIRGDLKVLSEHGIKYLRVFPLWRDFQPVIPCMGKRDEIWEFRLEGERPATNPDYLDEVMLERFDKFCDICDEFGIQLIVALITGFMSGRVFIPPVMFGKDIYADGMALLFQQRFVRGFVSRFKSRKTIHGWDLGNECSGMWPIKDRFTATNWIATIANAIRANDTEHCIYTGMHGIAVDETQSKWSIEGEAEFTDAITTHAYSYWIPCAGRDRISNFRTTMHAPYENKMFADIVNKPGLVEETGTIGHMCCNKELAAGFLRINLLSCYANGATGLMWWCANDQTNIDTIPHIWYMTEIELGMMDTERKPKPVLLEMKKFAEFLDGLDFELPKAREDAVCVLTKDQNQWEVGYVTYTLAKQADINLKFCFGEKSVPEADTYIIPSVVGDTVLKRESFDYIKDRVYNHGATMYISQDFGIIAGFNDLTGLEALDNGREKQSGTIDWDGERINYKRERTLFIRETEAEVLARDDKGMPAVTRHKFGKGYVIYVNFPLENMLREENGICDSNYYQVYKKAFADVLSKKYVTSGNKYVTVTEHESEDGIYCVALNHSNEPQKAQLNFNGCEADKIYRGNIEEIPPFEGVIVKIKKL